MVQHTATEVDIHQLFNTKVYDRDGQEFAEIANVWVDKNEHPQFLGILTHGNENHIIPAQGAELSSRGDKVRLAYDKDTVNESPTCDPTKDLRDEDERKVYDFFQGKGPDVSYSSAPMGRSDYNQIEEEIIPLREGDVVANERQMGRSDYSQADEKTIPLREEELVVGKHEVEEGSVRLKKVVRSETVEQPIDLRREELVIEREAGSGEKISSESLGEEEYYIPLYHEEAVVRSRPVRRRESTWASGRPPNTRSSQISCAERSSRDPSANRSQIHQSNPAQSSPSYPAGRLSLFQGRGSRPGLFGFSQNLVCRR